MAKERNGKGTPTASERDERFDPFRRTDIHGEIGTASLPLAQRAALYARAAVLLPPRAAALLAGTLLMRFVCLLCVWLPALRAILLAPAASGIGRALLFVCGVVRVRHTDWRHRGRAGAPPVRSRDDTAVVVSNHVSWLDILMVQAYYAAAFVTRVETSRTPVIGGICDALPCIYVDRDKGGGGADAPVGSSTTAKLTARINVKHAQPSAPLRPVVAFVEGTTTNGDYLLPFHTGAFVAGKPVQPVVLAYGRRPRAPQLSWETIEAPRHIFLVLSTLFATAHIVELPMYHPSGEERADPALYARNVRRYMLEWAEKAGVRLKESASGYKDKKEFHTLLRRKHGLSPK